MQRRLSGPPPRAPQSPPPRLLLTGFGPFPGTPENASALLVSALAKRLGQVKLAIELRAEILPTEWKAAPDQVQSILKIFQPDIALHFGVASEATGFRLETMAQNARNRLSDATGHVHGRRRISATLPDQLLSTFPVDAIRQRLEALSIPVELSCDAGQYLCNATLFRSLSLTMKSPRQRYGGAPITGFVHIPSALTDPDQAHSLHYFGWSRAITGGLAIVETCLAHASSQSRQLTMGPAGGLA